MQDPDILQEFLIESAENLTRLDHEMVELERRPQDRELLASIFRVIHTIKGTCGFFGYHKPLLPHGVGLSTPSVVKGADYTLRVCGETLCERLHFADASGDFRVTLVIG